MKKRLIKRVAVLITIVILSFLNCVGCSAEEVSGLSDAYILGDVDLNGNVSSKDALIVLKHSVRILSLEGAIKNLADVNYDNIINSLDALSILKTSVGILSEENMFLKDMTGTITTQLFKRDKLKNADAKLMSNGVVTSINRKLTFIDFNGNIVKQYENSDVSWLDVCEDRVIVYGNNNKEIGICVIDENYNIISNNVIMNIEERLGIDPAICKVGNDYYITVTHITGAVNNGNPDVENGNYSVRMYKSSDLKSWVYVSEVLNYDTNLEDIDLNYYNGKFVLSYEKETFDKFNSSICVTTSKDMGKTWSDSKTLIEANADNEPASLVETQEGYCLYYSSDIEELGGSYETSRVYSQALDKNFNKVGSVVTVPLLNQNGNLLYDVEIDGNSAIYLFTEKYISQSNLIVEQVKSISAF